MIAISEKRITIDYNKFQFDPQKFVLSQDEPHVDRLLYTIDLIGCIVDLGALSPQELDVMAFEILRVMDNPEIRKYLTWLADEFKSRSHTTPLRNAQRLAEQLRKRVQQYKY